MPVAAVTPAPVPSSGVSVTVFSPLCQALDAWSSLVVGADVSQVLDIVPVLVVSPLFVALIWIVNDAPLLQVGSASQFVEAPLPDTEPAFHPLPILYSQDDIAKPLSSNTVLTWKGLSTCVPESVAEAVGPETTEGGVAAAGLRAI
jgi:hypothetical protein